MKKNSKNLNYAKIFLYSATFQIWQQYCRLRDKFKVNRAESIVARQRLPSEENIRKYIIPSKTYQAWLKSYQTRELLLSKYLNPIMDQLKKALPQPIKQKIRSIYSTVADNTTKIDPRISLEWKTWLDKRADDSLDIINFGVIPYEYRFQRPQQLAVSMGKLNHRVFYIETEFSLSLFPQKTKIKVLKKAKNVYAVTLTAPSNYFIYRNTASERGVEMMMSSLKILFRKARIINPVAKIDHPFWVSLRSNLSMPIVYDVMDLHSGFRDSGKDITAKHSEMVRTSDLVIASSDYLENLLKPDAKKVIHIKNAGEYDHFKAAFNKKYNKPHDLSGINSPIIGYYGALAEWLDTALIEKTANSFPNAAIVLIGHIQNKKLIKLASQYTNIHLLGEKSYQELPKYVAHFQVCLIPFRLTELIKATNPVKIYEYFAAGKPVVATAIPELNVYSKHLYLSNSAKHFVGNVGKALKEHSASKAKARQHIASRNTWDMRARIFVDIVNKSVFPKVSVIMLIYNHVKLSKIAIDSVLNRSKYGNLELLVVDNKSDRKTIAMLKTYHSHPRVKVILNPENYGFAKGNNVGLKLASGEYLILLNNDVRVTPGWIERLVFHARRRGIGLVGPVTNSIGNESKIDIDYDPDDVKELENKSADYTYAHWGETLELRNIAAFAWIMPRSVYRKLGGLDERFGRGLFEDDDYCMRVKQANLNILCAEDAFVHHSGGASTNWGSQEFQLLFNTNKVKFEQKWKTKWTPHEYRKK